MKWNVIAQSDAQYNNDMGWFFRSEHDTKEEAEAAREALQNRYDEQARERTPAYGITSNADRWSTAVCPAE